MALKGLPIAVGFVLLIALSDALLITRHDNATSHSCSDLSVNLTVPNATKWWGNDSHKYPQEVYANWKGGLCDQHEYSFLDSSFSPAAGVTEQHRTQLQHLIQCPLVNESDFIEIFITNTTNDYCGPTQIRTCSSPNGCVGMKYRNSTTAYERCSPEYMRQTVCTDYPCKHADWQAYAQLPARLRVDPSTAYLVFVCDEAPGEKAPIVQEYWPSDTAWPKSLPPMARMDCSNKIADTAPPYGSKGWHPFQCPWVTEDPRINPHSMCDACTDCRPYRPNDPSYHPLMWNITIRNPLDVTFRIDLSMGAVYPPVGPHTTCAWGDGYRGDGSGDLSPFGGADANQYLVMPFSNTSIALPPGVNAIFGIPMYSTGVGVCVRTLWSGFPKVLDLGTRGDGDRSGCIDSDGAYPGVR